MGETANRLYKDTVFRDLFGTEERKGNALSLYNALAGTDYRDPDDLELTTLDDVIYLNVKNDVSFLVGEEMVLWEHQSTRNPNMPLRGLVYFGRLYASYVERRRLNVYGSRLLPLPAPRYVVFYNGDQNAPESEELRLSDAYGGAGRGDVEVVATVLNVNAGSGAAALASCEELAGYAELVRRVRENSLTMGLPEAVDAAVASCIGDGVLEEYLRARRSEVRDMFMTEYDEEQVRKWYEEEGVQQGLEQGLEQGILRSARNLMEATGWDAPKALGALGVPEADRARYLEKLG